MAEPGEPPSGSRVLTGRIGTLILIAVWALPLLDPALNLPDVQPIWPAAAGLAAFVILEVAVLWSAFCWPIPDATGSSRLRIAATWLVAVIGVALAAGYGTEPGNWLLLLLYVGAAGVATVPGTRAAVAWLAATFVALAVVGAIRDASTEQMASVGLSTALAGVVVLMFRQMTELIGHLRRTQAELAETAVQAERSRFSRDLHDLLGHTLSLIVVKAEVAKRSVPLDPAAALRQAGDIEEIGRRALTEVREAVTGYRDRAFAAELDAARTALADAGLKVTVRTSGTPLPAPADGLFGWVVREAATNVVRHSSANHCQIELRRADGHATLEILDDGVGGRTEERAESRRGDGAVAGHGLSGLAERLADAGGHLEAGGALGSGWRVSATVPVTSSRGDRS